MLKFCKDAWDKNKDLLENAIRNDKHMNDTDYLGLVQMVVKHILNGEKYLFDDKRITQIDDGDYQGTLLFVIPRKTYQPCSDDYLMTYVWYGSCSGCDTLQGITGYASGAANEQQVKDYMTLCKDIVCNMVKPFRDGWRQDDEFSEVAEW